MNPGPYALLSMLGFALFLAGLAYRLPAISKADTFVFKALNLHTQRPALLGLFRFLWPVGTTLFAFVILLALILLNPRLGLLAGLALLSSALLERFTKLRLKRLRPFAELPGIPMRQPRLPNDPSFPSGDSLRVWFLAVLLLFLAQWSWPFVVIILSIATLISLGRIALGVHYPCDVLAGAGLGLLAAGLCLWAYTAPLIA